MKGANRKEIWAWGLYDFANSPFATTIQAVLFSAYFVEVVAGGEAGVPISLGGWQLRVPGFTFYTYSLAAAMFLVAVSAPILGAIADDSGRKKQFLVAFCYLGVAATGMLYFVHRGQYWRGALIFIVANIGFSSANVFYNAFLPEISTPRNIGWISGFGFTLGYLGGSALLAINLVMLAYPGWLGRPGGEFTLQECFLSVAIWWGLFAVPTFLWLRQRRPPARALGRGHVRAGLARLVETFRHVRGYSELSKFLLSFLIYNDGIQTVIFTAGIFGQRVIGMSAVERALYFLVVQMAAFAGALMLGAITDRVGNKRTVTLTLLMWSFITIWGYFIGAVYDARTEFWIIGVLAGLVLGGSQSASRALQGTFTPEEKSAEFFAFYGISGKIASVLGPLTYGSIFAITGNMRSGILSLVVFFVVGLALLLWVNEEKGIEQAKSTIA
ncbi:MAG: MFS transporter [Acidobacteriota bacterium]